MLVFEASWNWYLHFPLVLPFLVEDACIKSYIKFNDKLFVSITMCAAVPLYTKEPF